MTGLRQILLGAGMFLGSGVLLYAVVQNMDHTGTPEPALPPVEVAEAKAKPNDPLTADIETEARILEQKRLEREAKIAEQEARTKAFLSEQEEAERLALQKTRLENELYRNSMGDDADNAIEPVMDEPAPDTTAGESGSDSTTSTLPATPVVTARPQPTQNQTTQAQPYVSNTQPQSATQTTPTSKPAQQTVNRTPSKPLDYQVQRGDGLIKIARQYDMPVEALARANNLTPRSDLRVGQNITIPASNQVDALVRASGATVAPPKQQTAQTDTPKATTQQSTQQTNPTPTATAPTRQLDYQVQRGDGLIKLARQYNVPVEALAQANNMSTSSNLQVGQSLTIPSRRQVARLEREAKQAEQARQAAQTAQQRLREGRKAAANGEVKGEFGVQIALADNQAKADELVKKLRGAGYSATTSATSRGVRVIVGPETGKPAALALKDKINADPKVGVNGAWVLYWR